MSEPLEADVVATGLRFPEGPVARPDGACCWSRSPGERSARCGPTAPSRWWPTAAADRTGPPSDPTARVWLCNNGGFFTWRQISDDLLVPGRDARRVGGRQHPTGRPGQRVGRDGGHRVRRPAAAGPQRPGLRSRRRTVVHRSRGHRHRGHRPGRRALPVAGRRGHAAWPTAPSPPTASACAPTGDRLYVAETHTGRIWAWDVVGPGQVGRDPASDAAHGGTLLFDAPEGHLFDSLAVDGAGWVCVATLGQGGITCVAPDGSQSEHLTCPTRWSPTSASAARTGARRSSPRRGVGELLRLPLVAARA